jgi:hypothetical protein
VDAVIRSPRQRESLWLSSAFLLEECFAFFGETIWNKSKCFSCLPNRTQDRDNLYLTFRFGSANNAKNGCVYRKPYPHCLAERIA